ncbi:hypothetical protein TEA_010995 [Camellia sinensis var. sinensis]|uniref:BHLH domain-containing protein n=1 Tax=Camellia sinensis var. sinensis TaxID=542762 RepID=A0A4S4DZC8_CAMSN|nr:hypothetical protein TEA_010995 [Camellia sinensis var. sinensis]
MKEIKREEEEEEKRISRLLLSTMEGYSDSVIPPLTELSPVCGTAIDEKGSSSRKRGRAKATEIENIQKERKRREKMTEKFSVLQSIVPNLLPKGLEKERERLENLIKKTLLPESMAATHCANWNSSVDVTVSGGGVVFFGIRLVCRRHLATEIFEVFEKHEAEVLAATFLVDGGHHQQRRLGVTVTAVVGGDGDDVGKIKRDILNL